MVQAESHRAAGNETGGREEQPTRSNLVHMHTNDRNPTLKPRALTPCLLFLDLLNLFLLLPTHEPAGPEDTTAPVVKARALNGLFRFAAVAGQRQSEGMRSVSRQLHL